MPVRNHRATRNLCVRGQTGDTFDYEDVPCVRLLLVAFVFPRVTEEEFSLFRALDILFRWVGLICVYYLFIR